MYCLIYFVVTVWGFCFYIHRGFWSIGSVFIQFKAFYFSCDIFSLIQWLFSNVSFNFHISVYFSHILWLLIFNLLPLWPKTILCMISILLNFLRLVSWSNVLSTLENVACALEKNVYSAVLENMFYRCLLIMLFKSSVFLLIFCLLVLSIIDRSILMSPPIIVKFSISPFNSIISCFMYFDAVLGTYIFIIVMSWEMDLFAIIKCLSLSLVTILVVKSVCLILI